VAKKLLVVESPGKIKKLSQILGSDWIVKASMGHVRELANDGEDSLGFDLEQNSVRCRFVARGQRGKETIAQLQAAVRQVDTVVLATDPDREGETIAWHLQQACI
jgi:DNA topoisomerase-1